MTPRERSEQRAKQRDLDLQAMLASPAGRRVLWRMIQNVGLAFATAFNVEPLLMARTEGTRAVGLYLMAEAQRVDPELYLVMMEEAFRDRRTELAQDVADAVHQEGDADGV